MVRNLKLPVRWLLERTTVGYLALLRHDEVARTLEQVARLNLPAMGDPAKNWDGLAAWIAFSRLPPRRSIFSMEHGVNLASYCKEMWRILKPGGLLVASTDCWQTPMELGPTFLRRSHPCVYREGGSERASSRQTKQFRHDWTDRPLLYRELGRD